MEVVRDLAKARTRRNERRVRSKPGLPRFVGHFVGQNVPGRNGRWPVDPPGTERGDLRFRAIQRGPHRLEPHEGQARPVARGSPDSGEMKARPELAPGPSPPHAEPRMDERGRSRRCRREGGELGNYVPRVTGRQED